MQKTRDPHLYISLGSGVRLLSEEHYLDEFRRFGMSKIAFRRFLRAIQVPRIQIGNVWLIEHYTFLTCLKAATSAGQPDFITPGCRLIQTRQKKHLKDFTRTLDPEFLRKNLPTIQEELSRARSESGSRLVSREEAQREVRKASDILFATSLSTSPPRADSEECFLASVRERMGRHAPRPSK